MNYGIAVYFLLTSLCNLKCPYCIREYTEKTSENFMDTKVALSVLKNISEKNKNISLVLTGGEPTLHKDFFEILDFSCQYFPKLTLATNGIVSKEVLEKLKSVKNIAFSVSLDGDEISHDRIRGGGNFNKTIDFIKKINLTGNANIFISTTVSKRNIDSIPKLALTLEHLKIKRWYISIEQALNSEEIKYQLSNTEWNDFVDNMIKISKIPLAIKKMYDFSLFEKMENKFGRENIAKNCITNCGFCVNKMFVYPDFSVRACTCLSNIILGNLRNDSFETILENMKAEKCNYKLKPESPCNNCKWLYLCNGGCLGYSYHHKGGIGYGDIRCPIVKEAYGL